MKNLLKKLFLVILCFGFFVTSIEYASAEVIEDDVSQYNYEQKCNYLIEIGTPADEVSSFNKSQVDDLFSRIYSPNKEITYMETISPNRSLLRGTSSFSMQVYGGSYGGRIEEIYVNLNYSPTSEFWGLSTWDAVCANWNASLFAYKSGSFLACLTDQSGNVMTSSTSLEAQVQGGIGWKVWNENLARWGGYALFNLLPANGNMYTDGNVSHYTTVNAEYASASFPFAVGFAIGGVNLSLNDNIFTSINTTSGTFNYYTR